MTKILERLRAAVLRVRAFRVRLRGDWKRILKRAWSVRLMGLAAALSGIEAVLPFLEFRVKPGLFAVLSAITTAAAFVARLVAQSNMRDKP